MMVISEKINLQIRNTIKQLLNKKASFLVAVLFFLEIVFFNEIGDLTFFSEIPIRLILCGLTGTLFFYLTTLESYDTSKKSLFIVGMVAFFTMVFLIWANNYKEPYLIAQIPLIFLVTLLFHKSFLNTKDPVTWDWQNSFAKTVLEAVFIGIVFIIAINLLVYLVEFVFEVDVPRSFQEFIAQCGASIVPSIVYLARIEASRDSISKFDEGVINFIVTPLWAVYVVFLNIYAFKILVNWSLPQGMVAIPVTIAFIVFTIKWWGSVPLSNKERKGLVGSKPERVICWMQTVLLGLFWIAVARRLLDYGVTQPRYFLILLGVFYTGIVGLDLSGRLKGQNYALLFLSILVLSLIKVA